MNIAQIRKIDVANGVGVGTTVFVSGCTNNCEGCFNKEYSDFKYGQPYSLKILNEIIDYGLNENITHYSILGGEPMQQDTDLAHMLFHLKSIVGKPIWMWTGFTWEEIVNDKYKKELLQSIDILVDGRFVEAEKDLTLRFKGSSNQRIIDVKKSLEYNKVVLFME